MLNAKEKKKVNPVREIPISRNTFSNGVKPPPPPLKKNPLPKIILSFTHMVLFQISPKEIPIYHKDCSMWADYARHARGFIRYQTVERIGCKNQFASVYEWKTKKDHFSFMGEYHDHLVSKSKAKVKVLGYYNLMAVASSKICPSGKDSE